MFKYQNLLTYLTYPLRAVSSRRFYYTVFFAFRGAGFSYILLLSALIAIPACIKVKTSLEYLQQFELPTVVAKIPASYVDSQGQLYPKNDKDNRQILIANSKGQYIIAYNLDNAPLHDLPNGAIMPITITSNALMIHTDGGIVNLPWSSFYGSQGGDFEPLEAAKVLDATFSSSYMSVWVIVTIWLLSIISFAVLVASAITKVFASTFLKLSVTFASCLRLCAYGSTAIAFLLLAQFFFNLSLSYLILCLVPTFYSISFLNNVRQTLALALESPREALSRSNPLWIWFEVISRLSGNNNTGKDVLDYLSLNAEEQQKRVDNLQKNISNNVMGMAFMYFAGAILRQTFPELVDYSRADISRLNGNAYKQENNGFAGYKNHSETEDNNMDPYEFNDRKSDDDPIFKEKETNTSKEEHSPFENAFKDLPTGDEKDYKDGGVRRGSKGDDSSFMP